VPRLLCLNLRAIRKVSVSAGTETNKLTPSAWNVVSPTCLANGVFSLPDACLFSQPKPLFWQSDKFFTPFSTFWTNPPYHIWPKNMIYPLQYPKHIRKKNGTNVPMSIGQNLFLMLEKSHVGRLNQHNKDGWISMWPFPAPVALHEDPDQKIILRRRCASLEEGFMSGLGKFEAIWSSRRHRGIWHDLASKNMVLIWY